jgi:DeoR family transcriptional regulator, suf operon transcriptional repressor
MCAWFFERNLSDIPLVGPTKAKILDELHGSRRKTANQIASDLKIQVSAVRKHLESLCIAGMVVQEFVREGIGRPKKFYSLSEFGREMFPRQYELVLNSLIEKLISTNDRSFVENLLKRVAPDVLGPKQGEHLFIGDTANFDEKVQRLNTSMVKFGFDSTVERTDGKTIRLVSHNCPLYKSAKRFPDLLCKGLHAEMIKVALGTKDVKLERCVLSGDSTCVHSVELSGGTLI